MFTEEKRDGDGAMGRSQSGAMTYGLSEPTTCGAQDLSTTMQRWAEEEREDRREAQRRVDEAQKELSQMKNRKIEELERQLQRLKHMEDEPSMRKRQKKEEQDDTDPGMSHKND